MPAPFATAKPRRTARCFRAEGTVSRGKITGQWPVGAREASPCFWRATSTQQAMSKSKWHSEKDRWFSRRHHRPYGHAAKRPARRHRHFPHGTHRNPELAQEAQDRELRPIAWDSRKQKPANSFSAWPTADLYQTKPRLPLIAEHRRRVLPKKGSLPRSTLARSDGGRKDSPAIYREVSVVARRLASRSYALRRTAAGVDREEASPLASRRLLIHRCARPPEKLIEAFRDFVAVPSATVVVQKNHRRVFHSYIRCCNPIPTGSPRRRKAKPRPQFLFVRRVIQRFDVQGLKAVQRPALRLTGIRTLDIESSRLDTRSVPVQSKQPLR